MLRWSPERRRALRIALGVYAVSVAVYFAMVPRYRIVAHTAFNHFALLAEAWLHGRLDLNIGPPAYAQNNDFAAFGSKWYVAFPPFPAVLLLPIVFFGKTAENVRDGQFFIWLSGIAPAVLFLVLDRLRTSGRSDRSERDNVMLALLFAFGTVYFFTSLQGTVWFAAHVVGATLAALFALCSIDARWPALAGLMAGFGFLTRTPLVFMFPLFAFEAVRVALPSESESSGGVTNSGWRSVIARVDRRKVARSLVVFSLPLALCIGLALVHNKARFHKFGDFGYEYLTVFWQARMKKWGLFNYHYLARNLGVVLTGLPFHEPGSKIFQVNEHGLALWFTTPLYLWLVWPKKVGPLAAAVYVTTAAVAIPGLLYQNTGWMQFGYRFSNDYAVFLFILLALTGRRFGTLWKLAALWSVAVNAFGAYTFDRGEYKRFYYEDTSQKTFYEPD